VKVAGGERRTTNGGDGGGTPEKVNKGCEKLEIFGLRMKGQ